MGFVKPIALAFAALSIPILLLYMLKLRRREVVVSSTLLWERLVRDREANTPWQRLRRNLLLLLQLLILALLTVALARPFLPTSSIAGGSVVILLDASASMQATDIHPTRFEAARGVAQEVLSGLRPGEIGSIISVGPKAVALTPATGDRAALRRALANATPSNGPADWQAAAALTAATAAGAEEVEIVIISDGAMEPLPPLPGEVRFVSIGERGDNLGITALALREARAGPQGFLQVSNFGDAAVDVGAEFRADGRLLDVRPLTAPPHDSARIVLDDLPYDLTRLEVRLTTSDPLPLDDVAWAVRSPPSAQSVLLVTPGNLFLEHALEMLPGVELTRLAPNQPLPPESYDLIVHDGTVTRTLPAGNVWAIGQYGDASTLFTNTRIIDVETDDPILRHVDLDDVHVLQAWKVGPLPGAQVLIEAEGGPLLLVAERPEGRLAVLTFDLHDSDLPLRVAFPILTANLTQWLLPQRGMGETTSIHPGDPIVIQPVPDAEGVVVTAPDGSRHQLPVGESPLTFTATEQLGVYEITQVGPSDALLRSSLMATNLFREAESDITPLETVRVGETEVRMTTQREQGQRELWPWLTAAALGVLAWEWWVYQRGSAPLV
jgi:hypothetical protein